MSGRRLGWGILAVIVLLVGAAGVSLLDRRPPIADVGRDFLGWTGPLSFMVDYTGVRHRWCRAVTTRKLLNGSGRNTHEYSFAPYSVSANDEADLGAFVSPPREIEIPHGVDLAQPLTLSLEVDYVCLPLQALWPIRVIFPPLPIPPPGELAP